MKLSSDRIWKLKWVWTSANCHTSLCSLTLIKYRPQPHYWYFLVLSAEQANGQGVRCTLVFVMKLGQFSRKSVFTTGPEQPLKKVVLASFLLGLNQNNLMHDFSEDLLKM